MSGRRQLVAANWKMNGSRAANDAWLNEFFPRMRALRCDVVVCPPYPYLAQVRHVLDPQEVGAQDVSADAAGAHTGDVAAEMLRDAGCGWVIVGHSERRQRYGETNTMIATKVERTLQTGLRPILCIGETLQQREAGQTHDVLRSQLAAVLEQVGAESLSRGAVAYEPVWAIGTGRTATPEQAQEVHAMLRAQIGNDANVRILYGGSVKPSNAGELFAQPDIDGGLIGGASLVAQDFLAICDAVPK